MIESIPKIGYQYKSQGNIKVQVDSQRDPNMPLYKDGRLEIYENFTIKVNGNETILDPLEYKLLTTFVSRPNQFLDKSELLEKVWGNYKGSEGSLRSYIMKLRKMVEPDPKNPRVIIRDINRIKNDTNQRYSFQSQGEIQINVYAPIPNNI